MICFTNANNFISFLPLLEAKVSFLCVCDMLDCEPALCTTLPYQVLNVLSGYIFGEAFCYQLQACGTVVLLYWLCIAYSTL